MKCRESIVIMSTILSSYCHIEGMAQYISRTRKEKGAMSGGVTITTKDT